MVQDEFRKLFGSEPTTLESAPGRVNLIGEHTDYNEGFVLPTPIPQKTHVALARRTDRSVRLASDTVPAAERQVGFELGLETRTGLWHDYVQGMTRLLNAGGFAISGFSAFVTSEVPMGSGLSSSAALSVAFLRALRKEFELDLTDVAIARLCQRIENDFVGARVGIMDPMASSIAEVGSALFLDCQDLSYRQVTLPRAIELVVIHSGVSHSNASGGYNRRREECEQACRELGVTSLREVTLTGMGQLQNLPTEVAKRARHVVTENVRVQDMVAALEDGDQNAMGDLLRASHASMRDDYEITVSEIDCLVDLANAEPGIIGARMTGGGFGGSIIALAERGRGYEAGRAIARKYKEKTGREPTLLVPGHA